MYTGASYPGMHVSITAFTPNLMLGTGGGDCGRDGEEVPEEGDLREEGHLQCLQGQ